MSTPWSRLRLGEMIHQFDEVAQTIAQNESPIHKSFVSRELHPLLMCSPFVHRTFTKPLGYAGDYEMVNMILNDPWQGGSTYARVINAAFLRTSVAQGHRNRIDLLTNYLKNETRRVFREGRTLRVLNIGCGPAAEVVRFIRDSALSNHCHIQLMDFNQETLDYAKTQIQEAIKAYGRAVDVQFIHRSIHQLLKDASSPREAMSPRHEGEFPGYDLVYCAGLFDYLSDRICKRLTRLFYDWTLPGGMVLTTNVHKVNSFHGTMEHLMDWNLLLRDESEMLELAPNGQPTSVDTDATGTNLFLEVRKTETPS